MEQRAFQDGMADAGIHDCWGCGSHNPHGLRIKSYWSTAGDEAICTWQPQGYHVATPGALNGGIIATIMDCHSVCTAIADAYRRDGRAISADQPIAYVTAALHVMYVRPTPINGPVVLRARIKEVGERKTTVVCSLCVGGDECARAETLAVRIPWPPASGL